MLAGSRFPRCPLRLLGLTAGLVSALTLAACSGSSHGSPAAEKGGATFLPGDPHVAKVTITSAQCQTDRQTYDAGGLTINVSNSNATGVTEVELLEGERIIGEKENLPPGFSGSFSLNIQPGTYTLYCPGANTERVRFVVAGTAATSPTGSTHDLLVEGTKTYGAYVDAQVGLLFGGVTKLAAALNRPQNKANLALAQAAYDSSRVYYERIEPVAESFTVGSTSLDAAIDSRANDVGLNRLTGFHRIEYGLFTTKSLAGLASFGAELVRNVAQLQKLTKGLSFQSAELANGAAELLEEVQKTKITGEEERYSHIDLLDFQANVEGAEQAMANLQDGLQQIDPTLSKNVSSAFASVDRLLDTYRTASNPSGFRYYAALTARDKQALAAAVRSVAEPLSEVAGKVVSS